MKEEDIRPRKIFDEYLALAKKDVNNYFLTKPFYYVSCPACKGENSRFKFRKYGFDYEECDKCKTLYVNPRPTPESFSDYYSNSPSVKYWATNFYKETESSRRELIIKPKAKLVKRYLDKYLGDTNNTSIIDIGAGYGVFCEELQLLADEGTTVVAIEPSDSLNRICIEKGLKTVPKFIENVYNSDFEGMDISCAISFELLEHLHNPELFIQKCSEIISPEGLLIITTLTWDGFDLQVLQDKSSSIHPPHHLNFFTKKSLSILLERNGFEVCEITTPGKLDVDIVSKQLSDIKDPFIRKLIESDQEIKDNFQTFLQEAGLSSHMMAVAKKK
ncbi:class I SAM-dependent methyltransferase [Methanoplanus limicola]|uniref:Methyltransferase type 12 n=1 Tax=Methanoplanus limicola DSM 2279 TaxID=937775 RepID=H1YXD4_9EURY|nr:class I SAM-dependent methyltransferase [Methanoplanus limicola]EHQ36871.1 Methyltransferase type 12 [Methanoplanus limicola DSM 2279]